MSEYKTTIGIEVHAELKTASKMFCGCKNNPHEGEVNTNICPVCTAQPGTLPVINRDAVEKVLKVGVAVGAELADYSEFDRKNYFYPDIPKAYQISQYAYPLVTGGMLGEVAITRVHLEEDTARSQHEDDVSLVDFNRAGVPLMELVTEPVIHSAREAADFARELQLLLRILEVSDANMERGEMRVEANISVSTTDVLGTKVEVKNLNSFKVVEAAIEYEVKRQIALLEAGGIVIQETRGWDDAKNQTYSQRKKETADDYRYFPDPDIIKYKLSEISEFSPQSLSEKMPKLAPELRISYKNLGLNDDQIETILQLPKLRYFFQSLIEKNTPTGNNEILILGANYLTSDVLPMLQTEPDLELKPALTGFYELMHLLTNKEIGSRVAKDLLPEVIKESLDVQKALDERGLRQNSNEESLNVMIDDILRNNPTVIADYKSGNENAAKFLVGQGMKASKGSANPALLQKLILEKLNS